jgi:hypothetical protein
MRLNQILTEAEQQELKMLQEGPLGSLAKAAGRGVGNVIGGVAGAAGAAKGAVKGAIDRVKSSFKAGEKGAYNALAGEPDSGSAAGAAKPAAGAPAAPAGDAAPAAKPATPGAAPAATGGSAPAGSAPASGGAPAAATGDGAAQKTGTLGDLVKGFKKGMGVKGTDTDADQSGTPQKTGGGGAAAGGTAGGTTDTPAAGGAEPADPNAPAGDTAAEPGAAPAPDGKPAAGKPAAKPGAGGAKAAQPGAADAANDTEYAKVQKAVDGLPPEQRKELIAALQADPKVKAAMAKPAAKKPATLANTMANAPVDKTNKAKPGNPNAAAPVAAPAAKAEPTAKTGTVQQKQLTNKGFGQMVGGLTKKAG